MFCFLICIIVFVFGGCSGGGYGFFIGRVDLIRIIEDVRFYYYFCIFVFRLFFQEIVNVGAIYTVVVVVGVGVKGYVSSAKFFSELSCFNDDVFEFFL